MTFSNDKQAIAAMNRYNERFMDKVFEVLEKPESDQTGEAEQLEKARRKRHIEKRNAYAFNYGLGPRKLSSLLDKEGKVLANKNSDEEKETDSV